MARSSLLAFSSSFSSFTYFFLRPLRFFDAQCFSQPLFFLSCLPGWVSQSPGIITHGSYTAPGSSKGQCTLRGCSSWLTPELFEALTPSQVASATSDRPPADPILSILPVTQSQVPLLPTQSPRSTYQRRTGLNYVLRSKISSVSLRGCRVI